VLPALYRRGPQLKVHSAPPNKVDAAEMFRLSHIVGEFAGSLGYFGEGHK